MTASADEPARAHSRWRRTIALALTAALGLFTLLVPGMLLRLGGLRQLEEAAAPAQSAVAFVSGQFALDVPVLGLPLALGARIAHPPTDPFKTAFVARPPLASGAAAASAAPSASTRRRGPKPANAGPLASLATRKVRASAMLNRLLAPGRFAYHEMVSRYAAKHAVQLPLVMAIIASESGGDPDAVSPEGAVGLMQLMPDTAARLGVDPWDPEQNVEGAVRYLASLISDFKSVDLSLIAYNAGPGFAARYRKGHVELGAETRAFLTRVSKMLQ